MTKLSDTQDFDEQSVGKGLLNEIANRVEFTRLSTAQIVQRRKTPLNREIELFSKTLSVRDQKSFSSRQTQRRSNILSVNNWDSSIESSSLHQTFSTKFWGLTLHRASIRSNRNSMKGLISFQIAESQRRNSEAAKLANVAVWKRFSKMLQARINRSNPT